MVRASDGRAALGSATGARRPQTGVGSRVTAGSEATPLVKSINENSEKLHGR